MSAESMSEWGDRLAGEAFAAGRDVPHSWLAEYDDGSDGCMPAGWYVIGLDGVSMPITWPVRHEYGPYPTKEDAGGVIDKFKAAYGSPPYHPPR